MARKKKNNFWKTTKTYLRSSVASKFLLLILIFTAFFLLDGFFENPKTSSENKSEQKQLSNKTKLINPSTKNKQQTHLVNFGDNLSKIAEKYYGEKDKWVVIAAENNIQNPNLIYVGVKLTIPDLNSQTSSITTKSQDNIDSQQTVSSAKNHTVNAGDTLWEISIQYYGSGYEWFRIRDANPEKVGVLSTGRPLIIPGTVLSIPNQ